MRRWIDVATLTKTRNLDGSFVARAATGLPFLLQEGMAVALVPPQIDIPRTVTVRHVEPIGDGSTAEVSFDEVADVALAKQMLGMHCIVERSAVGPIEPVEAPALLEGFSVMDEKEGLLGTVQGIVENPGQSLLEVRRAQSQEDADEPLLIPLVDEFILGVDFECGRIDVRIPAGLLEL